MVVKCREVTELVGESGKCSPPAPSRGGSAGADPGRRGCVRGVRGGEFVGGGNGMVIFLLLLLKPLLLLRKVRTLVVMGEPGQFWWKDRKLLLFGAVVFLLHLVFFVLQCIFQRSFLADSVQYLNLADNLLEHGTFYSWDLNEPIDMQGYSQRPPGYPLFWLPFRLFSDSVFPGLLVQCLVSTVTFLGLYRLWEDLGLRIAPLWGALPALVFFPAQLIYANMVMSEILFQACIFWAFFFLVRFIREPQGKYLLIYNLLLCAGLLTKPVLYLWWIPNVVIIGWFAFRQKQFKWLTFAAIPVVAIVLWCGGNYLGTGYYHFSSITSINLLNYNAYHALLEVYGPEEADSVIFAVKDEAALIKDFAEREKYVEKAATDLVMEHKVAYAKFHLKGMVNFFLDPGRFDLYQFFGWQEEGFQGLLYYFSKDGYVGIFNFLREQPMVPAFSLVSVMIWNLLLLLALLNFMFLKKVPWEIRLLTLLMIGYICAATGPLGASRFKLPIYPLMVLTVPFLWERVGDLWRKFRKLPPGPQS